MTETQSKPSRSTMTLMGGICALVGFVLWLLGAFGAPLIAAFGFVLFVVGLIVLITGKIRDRR
jgi:Flp pilus assembly protein TadB